MDGLEESFFRTVEWWPGTGKPRYQTCELVEPTIEHPAVIDDSIADFGRRRTIPAERIGETPQYSAASSFERPRFGKLRGSGTFSNPIRAAVQNQSSD